MVGTTHEHTYEKVGTSIFCIEKGCGAPIPYEDLHFFSEIDPLTSYRHIPASGEDFDESAKSLVDSIVKRV